MMDGMRPLASIPIQVDSHLVGMKRAFRFNGTIYVSPAMWDLLKNEEGESLEYFLRNLHVVDLGTYDPLHMPPVFHP